jgi:4-hydroxy-2-oxovalerate aldolase
MAELHFVDLTLRDGMHAVSHQFTPAQMALLAHEIDTIGVEFIEFGHGNGLGGSSIQYGMAAATDEAYMQAVRLAVEHAKLVAITLPGIGTRFDLQMAVENGIEVVRFATQLTESDIAKQHVAMAKRMGLHPWAVLPTAKPLPVDITVRYAQIAEKQGAEVVYLLDGGGSMLPDEVFERVFAMHKTLDVPIGIHAHNNLQLAVANTLAAVDAGAQFIDCCIKGFGAGAGNCPVEPLVAALERKGVHTGINLYRAMDVGDEYLRPLMDRPQELESDQIMLGYAGIYSSFLLFARRAGERHCVDTRDIIKEIGRRGCTEGQEQLCIQVAWELAQIGKGTRIMNE